MEFDFYIMQPTFGSAVPTTIGILQNVESVVWANYTDDVGDVEIVAALTDYNLEMLQRGNYIRKPLETVVRVGETWAAKQDVTVHEIAEIFDVTTDVSNQTLKASARMLDCMFETRINAAYQVLNGNNNFITWFGNYLSTFTNQSSTRSLPMIWRAGNITSATFGNCSVAYNTIAEIIESAREQNEGSGEHSGFFVRAFHSQNGDWAGSTLAAGVWIVPFWSWNRTGTNDPVIFRYDKDDIDNVKINESNEDWSNFAFVAGEGEGTARTMVWYPTSSTTLKGVTRRELFVDARDLKSEDYANATQYQTALRNRGREKLVAQVETIEFDLVRSDYVFGVDYYLGDSVGVVVKEISTMLTLPVSGAVESFTSDGYSLSLEFGQPAESFSRRIRKRLK